MKSSIAFSALFASLVFQHPVSAAERPPQFVAIAFDNCTELERWQELSDFAARMNADGSRLHFTFFVSAVNFVADEKRGVYESPFGRGVSRINFGGSREDVRRRLAFANDLFRRGHEIASHAVGHFNGAAWTVHDWDREFKSYAWILQNPAQAGGAEEVAAPAFENKITGFRAPYLATSPGLYETLRSRGFRYDASGNSAPDAWPEKIDGIWRFNLARLKLHKMNRSTLSMDYNFFVLQSGAVPDARRFDYFREQILQTYLDYFHSNYTGNRAPIHIGHHFFDYQNGAYKQALMEFARRVCGLPEVRCTTYSTIADFMDGLDGATLEDYRKGDFPRAGDVTPDLAFSQ
jgi:hypothetical protein